MDRDIDGAPTLVHDLNHLLVAIALRHAYQSAKLTNAVVYVYYVVAHLKLLNLLERQRHFTRACLVGRQTVLVETVEDLMVSEYAESQIVVSKTFMECLFDGVEEDTAFFGKDIAQTLQLFLAVCQDAELIAIGEILFERLLQQLKVFVELGLGRDMEGDSCIGHA